MLDTLAAGVFDTEHPHGSAVFDTEQLSGAAQEAPFVIEHRREEYDQSGAFRPSARLLLTDRVRTSGLWRALTPEDFKTLALLLTFLTPNGWCRPTLPELADAMGASHAKARGRIERLLKTEWRGQPLAGLLPRPDGLDAYLPGRQLVAHEDVAAPAPPQPAPPPVAGKEAVVAHSRARYAKTRAEVEAQISAMMGWDKKLGTPPAFPGEDPAVADGKRRAFKAMTDMGVPRDQALDLLARFDLGAVERQIAWLPQRNAKSPARFLAAAVEGDYDRPTALRRQTQATIELEAIGPAGTEGGNTEGKGEGNTEARSESNPAETPPAQ